MTSYKYWLTKAGWKANFWFHRLGLHRLPFLGRIWFAGKRLVAGWLSSGRGVPLLLGGQPTYVHPFTYIYSNEEAYEPYTHYLFENAINPGCTVLDLGAHHGYFSLLAARCVGKEGKVYAFEPAPENFQILKKNIELNKFTNVFPINKAVNDSANPMSFFLCKPNDVSGSLFPTLRPNEFSVPVESVAIDDFLEGERVDVVKMDIEGSEPSALKGMKRTLSQNKNIVLIVEINPRCLRSAGVEPVDFLAQLADAGFECQLIDEDQRRLYPTNADLILEEESRRGHFNIYCVEQKAQ